MMTITFLGTASGVPVPHRNCSAILVEQGLPGLLLDAGEGVTQGLLRQGISFDRIGHVCITHTHVDHVTGLPLLLQAMHLSGRTSPLVVQCPGDRTIWLQNLLHGMMIFPEKWNFSIDIRPMEQPLAMEGIVLQPFPNTHVDRARELSAVHGFGASSYSLLLVHEDTSIVYSSDLGSFRDIRSMAAGVSCLIVDSTHVEMDEIFLHAQGEPSQTVLCTHIPPEMEPSLRALAMRSEVETGGRVLFADDGTRVEITRTSVTTGRSAEAL